MKVKGIFMTKKEIKYIAYYTCEELEYENRNVSLAAVNKANYIIKCLNQLGYFVNVISPNISNNTTGFYKGKNVDINNMTSCKFFSTIGSGNKIVNLLAHYWSSVLLLMYLLLCTKKSENILVYHTQAFAIPIYIAKKIRKFNLILEVEEIYYKAFELKYDNSKNERRVIRIADEYIFVNDYLQSSVNTNKKPSCVLYGAYKYYDLDKNNSEYNKKILVYSGTIDLIQDDVFRAIDVSKYLNSNYEFRIIGSGSDESIDMLKLIINQHNEEYGCKIIYDGIKNGDAYTEYLKKCNIGLNLRKIDEKYDKYSFPSKVLSYLGVGLNVISTPIESVKKSLISNFVFFTQDDNPKSIASNIKLINIEKNNNRSIISELDQKFQYELDALLNYSFSKGE